MKTKNVKKYNYAKNSKEANKAKITKTSKMPKITKMQDNQKKISKLGLPKC